MSDIDCAASMPDIPDTARAMVLTGIRELEMQSFPIPEIGLDEGLAADGGLRHLRLRL